MSPRSPMTPGDVRGIMASSISPRRKLGGPPHPVTGTLGGVSRA